MFSQPPPEAAWSSLVRVFIALLSGWLQNKNKAKAKARNTGQRNQKRKAKKKGVVRTVRRRQKADALKPKELPDSISGK